MYRIKTEEIKVPRKKHCSYLFWFVVIETFMNKCTYFHKNESTVHTVYDPSITNNISCTSSHINRCFFNNFISRGCIAFFRVNNS